MSEAAGDAHGETGKEQGLVPMDQLEVESTPAEPPTNDLSGFSSLPQHPPEPKPSTMRGDPDIEIPNTNDALNQDVSDLLGDLAIAPEAQPLEESNGQTLAAAVVLETASSTENEEDNGDGDVIVSTASTTDEDSALQTCFQGLSEKFEKTDSSVAAITSASMLEATRPTAEKESDDYVADYNGTGTGTDPAIGVGQTMQKIQQNPSKEADRTRIGTERVGNDFQMALAKIAALTNERDNALQLNEDLQKHNGRLPSERSTEADSNASLLVELQASLQVQMSSRAEAENKVRQMEGTVRQMEEQLEKISKLEDEVEALNANLVQVMADKSTLELEVSKQRDAREDFERKEILLNSRLNDAKKKEANKANAAERAEFQTANLNDELSQKKKELEEMTSGREKLEASLEKLKKKAVERVKASEDALAEERNLNEERKKKMKVFVETKAEELRMAKSQNEEMQREIEETRTTLRQTREKLEHVHAEWTASQTRNRELQRDMKLMQKNSEKMNKIGDTLEHELHKSAQETEEHKNKRLTAKHELMTILRTLEAERSVSGKLRDSIKFTFTPKALSQQQLLTESLKDFEIELKKLSLRFGKSLPPSSYPFLGGEAASGGGAFGLETNSKDSDLTGKESSQSKRRPTKSDWDSQRLLASLEGETQKVSQGIMALQSGVERLHVLLDDVGERSCASAIQDFLTMLAHQQQETAGYNNGSEGYDEATFEGSKQSGGERYGSLPGNESNGGLI